MAVLRRLLVLSVVLAGAAVLASPGLSAALRYGIRGVDTSPNPCPPQPNLLGSQHFLVHYMSDASSSSCDAAAAITETQAGDVLGEAETAYAAEVGTYGYPAPVSDGALGGDNRIDIYVVDTAAASTGVLSQVFWDGGPPSSSGSFNLDAQKGLTPEVIAHTLFNVIQIGMWLPASASEYWLLEESAEWMSATVNGYDAWFFANPGPPDIALDCRDTLGANKCDMKNGYTNLGFARWPFWQSVSGKYGNGFVKEVFLDGAGNPGETALTALSHVLGAHSTNLADAFTGWALQQASGGYGVSQLDQQKPTIWGSAVKTGTVTTTLPKLNVPVNHLSTRILEFDRGDGSGASACFAATLTLTVNLPPGVGARPYFYWNGLNSAPVALSINGNTATTTQPWDTCTWFGNQAYLTLPNPSTDPLNNGQVFAVTAQVTVDSSKPGQSASPPPGAILTSPIVAVPTNDLAPAINVFGPELLILPAAAPTVRLIVESSGDGMLQASIGGQALGTVMLRAGNNDVRWALPQGLLAGLRRSFAAGSNVLTLTPLSPTGALVGTQVTRTVSIEQPATKTQPATKKQPATQKPTKMKPKKKPTKKPKRK